MSLESYIKEKIPRDFVLDTIPTVVLSSLELDEDFESCTELGVGCYFLIINLIN